jgi:SAM-dependent methyltransferase
VSDSQAQEFFDRQQESRHYEQLKTLTRAQDQAAADYLNAQTRGRVLSIGGVWERYKTPEKLQELTVLDLSESMLKSYAPKEARAVAADLYEVSFNEGEFDTVVFSLVLHHVARGGWGECERRVHDALKRAWRWLKPGGRVYVLEYCPHPLWMPLQRLGLPATKLILKMIKQPLVVMHARGFYERALESAGFVSRQTRRIAPPGFNEWAWFPVFMAVNWLRMPVKIYPKMHIFVSTKPISQALAGEK